MSLFSKALIYLGLVDEDQIDEEAGDRAQDVVVEETGRRPVEVIPQSRRVEPPPTARAATRPQSRAGSSDTIGLVRPVEIQSDILVVEEFGDARILADRVRDRTPVVLDLRRATPDLVRRVVDFSSGLIYALDGSMRKVGDGLVLVLPPRVVLSRDEKRRLTNLGAYEIDDLDD
ncbi:MAG TPA: cell division protein SepF [Acidimicrobiia bacterium]|nr:cell division protein SepF [Acidimicrobiia bacterium]